MRTRLQAWWIPAALIVALAVIVWLAPNEKTLGEGIKSIYVHVTLTWTGMFGLTVAGLLGLVTLANGSQRIDAWAQTIGWVALALFAAGLIMSLVAAQVNWNGIFWAEPRTAAAMQIVAVALVAQILSTWVRWIRLRGFLHVAVAAFMTWMMLRTQLVLHPRSPIVTSDSTGIQATFAALFVLCLAVAAWVVWRWHSNVASRPLGNSQKGNQ